MIVGTLRVRLLLREARTLKDKRQVVRSILDRLRPEFGVSAAEVEAQDKWQLIVLGMALVGTDGKQVRTTLERIVEALRRHPVAELIGMRSRFEPLLSPGNSPRKKKMPQAMPFGDVLEAADQLSPEEQQELIAILHRRLAQAGRQRLVAEVQEARQEFAAGNCRAVTPEELMREILK